MALLQHRQTVTVPRAPVIYRQSFIFLLFSIELSQKSIHRGYVACGVDGDSLLSPGNTSGIGCERSSAGLTPGLSNSARS
jgi:hypothetical protein